VTRRRSHSEAFGERCSLTAGQSTFKRDGLCKPVMRRSQTHRRRESTSVSQRVSLSRSSCPVTAGQTKSHSCQATEPVHRQLVDTDSHFHSSDRLFRLRIAQDLDRALWRFAPPRTGGSLHTRRLSDCRGIHQSAIAAKRRLCGLSAMMHGRTHANSDRQRNHRMNQILVHQFHQPLRNARQRDIVVGDIQMNVLVCCTRGDSSPIGRRRVTKSDTRAAGM
jgi:hypothetical protein